MSERRAGGKRAGYARVSEQLGNHLSEAELIATLAGDDPQVCMSGFTGVELSGVRTGDATFNQLVFHRCVFDHVDFSRTGMTDVLFRDCRFIACTMARCWLNRVDFIDCSAPGLNFLKSRLTGVTLASCQLRYADLSEAKVHGLRVRDTMLAESTWYDAHLADARFVRADLTRAEFVRTPLAGIDLSSCAIGGLTVSSDYRELRGCIIDREQAADLIGLLGVRIAEED